MVSSQQKIIGMAALGAGLLFLLRGSARAQEPTLVEPTAFQPSILPQAQEVQVPIDSEPSGVAPSPTAEPGSPLFNPALTRILTGTYQAFQPPAPTFSPDVFLMGQSDYTQPYSSWVQLGSSIISLVGSLSGLFSFNIPLLGTVLAGFIEGLLGSDPLAMEPTDYDWRVKLQWNELVRTRDLDIISKHLTPQNIQWWKGVVGLGRPSIGNDGPVYTLADIDKIIADPYLKLGSPAFGPLIIPPEFYNICKQIQKDPTYGMDIVFPQYKDIVKPWYYFVYGSSMGKFYAYNSWFTFKASPSLVEGETPRLLFQVDPSSNLATWHKILLDRDERYMGPITVNSGGPADPKFEIWMQIYGTGPTIPTGQELMSLLPPAGGNPFLGLSDDHLRFYYEKVLPEINWYVAGWYGTENLSPISSPPIQEVLSSPSSVSQGIGFAGFENLDSSPRFDVPKVEFRQVGFGSIVTPNTMKIMREMILNSTRDFYVRQWAEKIIGYADNDYSMAEAIFNFVVSNSRYVPDPVGMELLKIPQIPLQLMAVGEQPALDCDDATILVGALAVAVGIPYALRAVSFNREYSHVYGLVQIKERGWVPIDFVVGKRGGNFGDEPGGILAIKDMEI